jgi:hypothetical protein
MSVDSVPSSKTNIFQSKLYTFIYCRHFRTYSRCAMFDWSDTVFRRRNVTRRRISNTVLQPRYWGSEADSPEVCRLGCPIQSPIQSCRSLQALYLCKRLKSSPKTREHVTNDHVTIFDQNGRKAFLWQSLNTMFLS